MDPVERFLQEHFDLPPKNPSEEAQRRWRSAVGTIVKNRRRRFRMVPDLDRRQKDEETRRSIQEKIRVALYVQKAAIIFSDGAIKKEYKLTEDIMNAGFSINPDELASITSKHDMKAFKMHGGVDGISKKIRSTFDRGISTNDLDKRQMIYGENRYTEKPARSFWSFVWDALQDMTLIILMVPADGLFIHGYSLLLDESSLSGESDPVYISEDKPFILAGTKVQDGSAKMLVTAVAVTIIVVAVPEGLPLAVTLSLAFAMKQLMKDKALVRHLSACETMGSAGTICTDKTGTLTTNHMVVDKIWISEVSKSLSGNNSLDDLNSAIPSTTLNMLLQGIFENTSAEVVKDKDGKQTVLGTPTERAILEFGLMLEGHDTEDRTCTKVKVEPFNSVKKKMAVLVSLPNGTSRWFSKGASEIILQMCDMMVDGNGNSVPLSEDQRKNILDTINSFACDALRTLCLAYKEVNDIDNDAESPTSGFTLICIFGIKDPVRPGVKDAVKACISAGIIVRMVTGDNINTAKAIAKECGILTDDGIAIEGPEFRNKSPDEMRHLIPKIQVMARSLPLDKHTLVTNLRGMFCEVVAVTGDGTNDAPALHESDIGLAMGIAGTEVAKESADVIVLDDNFTTIINVARWGRAVYLNIQKFVQFQLTVNIVALVINFVSACITGSAPLTAVQLLWVNMIMDTLGALALATEPPNDDMMKRPPVGRGESFITKIMWRNIIGQSLYQLVVLGALMFGGERLLNIKGADSKTVINTLIFNSFVFCQVFNEINSREMQKINVFHGMFSNWIFLGIIAVTVAFQVVIIEFLGTFASTVPLDWQLWLVSIGLGSISLIVGAILKCIPVESGGTSASPNGYAPLPSGPDNI
ncbi:hypothetical protein PR202_gb16479 [Eleusine coracana subsp. coracana]|uniref:Calcium-transporting ATPase n=1 Tax=Eleusine coracana subsp. coracana TaxID=191504 RepID=A0AAV5F0H4_ELECO|nr:hypothetical protein PR202_gb16479 [Eleusine coracana subsp. coracana]